MSELYSQDVQKFLIEALISDPELYARCQNIVKEEYFDKQFQKTVKFILEFSNKYNSVPTPKQIHAKTGLDLEKIEEITPQHQKYLLDEVEGFCRHKALIQAVTKSVDLIEKSPAGIEKLIKDALLISLEKDLGTDYFDDPRKRLEKLKEENGTISTGWALIDRKLYNVGRGELLVFAAPSGGGKSVALQNLAINFAFQGLNCVYITLELKEELCAKRIDSMLTGIGHSNIYKQLDDVEIQVKQASKRSGNIVIKKMSESVTTTRDLRSYLKEYEIQTGVKPDVILVDYLDLMAPNDRRVSPDNLFIKDKFICEELRGLAVENEMLCVTASQLNRSAIESVEYDHSHIQGGISKIQTADNVIGIRSGAALRDRGEIQFQFLKTRNSGGVGTAVNLDYDIETLRITSPEEVPEQQAPRANALDRIKNRTNSYSDKPQKTKTEQTQEVDPKQSANRIKDLINRTRGSVKP